MPETEDSISLKSQISQLTSFYPQLTALSNSAAQFSSLASASPQTIAYLKTLGDHGVIAENQYAFIRSDPLLHEYYIAFNQAVSSAVLACQSIDSGMVSNAQKSKGETVMSCVQIAAGASGLPGASIAAGLFAFLVKLPNDVVRVKCVRRVTVAFPSVDSHKFIEILARELTILLQDEIRSISVASETARCAAWETIRRKIEWFQTLRNATAVQTFGSSHASVILNTLMGTDPAVAVQYGDIAKLIKCVMADKCDNVSVQLDAVRNGRLKLTTSAVQTQSAVHVATSTVASALNVFVPVNNGTVESGYSPVSETESLKAKLAAMEERDRQREERDRLRDEREHVRDAEMFALREESEKQKRIASALQKDVGKLSPKSDSTIGSNMDDRVHLHEARIANVNVAIDELIVQHELSKQDAAEKDEIIAEMAKRLAALESK
eukprot:gene36065-44477_t